MERSKKPDRTKEAEIMRFPMKPKDATDPKSVFMTKEEMIDHLKLSGVNFSRTLLAQLKVPPYVYRGKYEEMEFFDTSSLQPFPYKEVYSPSVCYDKKENAPEWLDTWYMAIVEEDKQKFLVLFFRPKKVFLKCELDKAEDVVPAVMWSQTIKEQ